MRSGGENAVDACVNCDCAQPPSVRANAALDSANTTGDEPVNQEVQGGSRGMLAAIAALALGVAASGCAWLGPDIVRVGRPAYNDAILATNDEQLLQNVVRMRFVDSLGFLAVNAIHANVTFTATGTVNAGFGSASNYAGNLVPFAGTLSTEQNPTISYSPVTGDQLLRQFAAEIPLDQAILMINYSHDARPAWRSLVRRVNNLRNPDFPNPPVLVVDPRLRRWWNSRAGCRVTARSIG